MKKKTMMGKLSSLLFALALVWGGGIVYTTSSSCRPNKVHNHIWFKRWIRSSSTRSKRKCCCHSSRRTNKRWLYFCWMAQCWNSLRLECSSNREFNINCKVGSRRVQNYLPSKRCWNRQPNNLHNRKRNFWIKSSNKCTRCN